MIWFANFIRASGVEACVGDRDLRCYQQGCHVVTASLSLLPSLSHTHTLSLSLNHQCPFTVDAWRPAEEINVPYPDLFLLLNHYAPLSLLQVLSSIDRAKALRENALSSVKPPHPTPQTSNPELGTPNPQPQTPDPKIKTPSKASSPKPQAPNPKPQTPNPKPQTPNSTLQIPNPKPRTPSPKP